MRNAECGIDRAIVEPRSEFPGSTSAPQFRIPHSALRIRGGGRCGWCSGFAPSDTDETLAWMADKILGLRVFADAEGKMNLALADVHGALLVVSQFTLYGDVRKGRRPSFLDAAPPQVAVPLYERFVALLRERGAEGGAQVATGEFGAMMEVELVNDGPVTLVLER
jgi:D-tyrosyl-tRNA(Tyr) deacylase